MNPLLAEMIGTALLILLGDGVVANVVLRGTKGSAGGWIVITAGWALAVFVGVLFAGSVSGAHLNPAVTVGLAVAGKFTGSVPAFIGAQMIGAAIGAFLVWLMYRDHFNITDEPNAQLAVFCTGPAIRNPISNVISEIIGTFVLVFAALHIVPTSAGGLGTLDALPIAAVVFVIGLSLGGTTGYAINPARDLAPRIMHMLLPMRGKRDSDWGYAWVPVIGPIIGGVLAAMLFRALTVVPA